MEPSSPALRFVLLEHRWNGVHWDFMLEFKGGLRTWAIDEPVAAGKTLDARALADHRSAFLDYEGPVSHGRGSVARVDGGTYHATEWTDDQVKVRLEGRQLVGEAILWKNPLEPSGPEGGASWKFRLGNVD